MAARRLKGKKWFRLGSLCCSVGHLLATSIVVLGSRAPELGRTQYRFGAVVLILKRIFLSVGFVSRMYVSTETLKGPAK